MNTQQTENAKESKPYIDASMLRIRLDTEQLLDQIESFLRGGRLVVETREDGTIYTKEIKYGVAKANQLGIQSILAWLQLTITPHAVQGNFPVDKHGYSRNYENFIYEYQVRLGDAIILNCYDWGIKDEEIEGMIDGIMLLVQPFFSRLIGNEERKSYAETLRHIESNTNKLGGIPFLKN